MRRKLLNHGRLRMEAASGLEPLSRGFADLRLNHLATPPREEPWSNIEDSAGREQAAPVAAPPRALQNRRRMLVPASLLLPLLFAFASQTPPATSTGPAPRRGPLTEAEVVFLLKSGVTPVRVRALADRYGVEFEMSGRVAALMREAGADAALVETLQRQARMPRQTAPVASLAPAAPAPSPPASPSPLAPPSGEARAAQARVSPLEPEMVEVPGGGIDIGRYEVTNRQYRLFCSGTSRRRPAAPFWGLQERYPVVN